MLHHWYSHNIAYHAQLYSAYTSPQILLAKLFQTAAQFGSWVEGAVMALEMQGKLEDLTTLSLSLTCFDQTSEL